MQEDKCFSKKKSCKGKLRTKSKGGKERWMEQCMDGMWEVNRREDGDGPCWRLELEEVVVEGWWLASGGVTRRKNLPLLGSPRRGPSYSSTAGKGSHSSSPLRSITSTTLVFLISLRITSRHDTWNAVSGKKTWKTSR
jgi:hypothetical protein